MARDLNNSYETFIGYADSCLTNQVDADNAFGGRRLRADSAPHWARVLGDLGHRVELLPARQVRAFVRSNKDDAADARAIWLAAQQSDIRRAPIKTIEQQAVMSLHRTRSHWVSVRTATINMLRGLLYEFGVLLPGGMKAGLKTIGARRAEIDDQLPQLMRRLVDLQLETLKDVERSIDQLEAEIAGQQRQLDQARTLREVPGIGVLGATALAATLGDASGWRSGREFSASLGLVPAHSGTGGKTPSALVSVTVGRRTRTAWQAGCRLRHSDVRRSLFSRSRSPPAPMLPPAARRAPCGRRSRPRGHACAHAADAAHSDAISSRPRAIGSMTTAS